MLGKKMDLIGGRFNPFLYLSFKGKFYCLIFSSLAPMIILISLTLGRLNHEINFVQNEVNGTVVYDEILHIIAGRDFASPHHVAEIAKNFGFERSAESLSKTHEFKLIETEKNPKFYRTLKESVEILSTESKLILDQNEVSYKLADLVLQKMINLLFFEGDDRSLFRYHQKTTRDALREIFILAPNLAHDATVRDVYDLLSGETINLHDEQIRHRILHAAEHCTYALKLILESRIFDAQSKIYGAISFISLSAIISLVLLILAYQAVIFEIKELKNNIALLAYDGSKTIPEFPSKDELREVSQAFSQLTDKFIRDAYILSKAKDEADRATKTKSAFLANMSHEIRTPVNGMLVASELLSESELPFEQKELADIIHASTKGLLKILNDILDISKIESGMLEIAPSDGSVHELTDAIRVAFGTYAQQQSVQLTVDMSERVPCHVSADLFRIRQVILNLVGNAIKFTPSGGNVVVYIDAQNFKGNTFDLLIAVADSGIGIDDENIEKVFEAFSQADNTVTRQYGGTGLGLTIARQIVRLLGGEIYVTSKKNVGSRFEFSVPVIMSASVQQPDTIKKLETNSLKKLTQKRVLVAEDNPVNQKLMIKLLEKLGMSFEIASNGLEAYSKWRDGTFDIILMDVSMPHYDGEYAIRKIRQDEGTEGVHIPIVVVSAHAMKQQVEEFYKMGADGYVEKPLKKEAFIEEILRQVG